MRKSPTIAIAAAIAAVTLASANFVGSRYFETHFVPGTTIGGINASWLTTDELAAKVEENVATYTQTITGDGLDFTVSADDVGLSIDGRSWAEEALEATSDGIWFVDAIIPRRYDPSVGVTLDKERLDSVVEEAVYAFNEGAEPPTNAMGTYDAEATVSPATSEEGEGSEGAEEAQAEAEAPSTNGAFVIIPESLGTAVSADSVALRVEQDLVKLHSVTTLNEQDLQRPPITAEDPRLISAVAEANSILAKTFILTLDGEDLPIDPIDSTLTRNWFYIVEGEDGPEVFIDEHAIWQWSWDNLNEVVNGENEVRTWEVDSGATAHVIADAMRNTDGGRTEVVTVTMETRPEETEGHEARGRHIDVNLSTQYARLYDTDGKTVLWRSYIVSGNINTGHGTVTGEFTIDNRDLDIVLVGADEDNDGEPDYRSPVRYWMGFYLNSYGFHDADWRWEDEFGGDVYLWDGSHGCINLPVGKAAELWELTDYGEKVYIHY